MSFPEANWSFDSVFQVGIEGVAPRRKSCGCGKAEEIVVYYLESFLSHRQINLVGRSMADFGWNGSDVKEVRSICDGNLKAQVARVVRLSR